MSCRSTLPRFAVNRAATRMASLHRQRVRRDGAADDPPALDLKDIPAALLPDVVAGWQRLMESEYESVVISGWMTGALARLGAPLDVLGAFGRVVEDEVRHVDVAADVLQALGATPTLPRDATPPVLAWRDDAEADEQAIAGMVAFFVIGELVSAHEFRHALNLVKLPIAQWALSEIHRDESFHGAFGFEAARLFVPDFKPVQKDRLRVRLTDELARFERRIGGPLEGPPRELSQRERDMAALGLPPPVVMLSVFYDALEKHVLPRLAELGVDLDVHVGHRE
ncbi:MAG: ferritin-like domain-containing protein [Deltaproteobacteria bacterium]|nr:ferritin-like domain-containing protein [Deltaproteobacteria bacterium]